MASPLPAICWATRTVSQCATTQEIDAAFDGLQQMDKRERDTAVMLAEEIFLQNLREEAGQKHWRKIKTVFNVAKTLTWVTGGNVEKEVRREFSKDREENLKTLQKTGALRHMAAKICAYRQTASHALTRATVKEIDDSRILTDVNAAHGIAYMKLMLRIEGHFRAAEKPPAQAAARWNPFRGRKPGA